MGLGSDPASLLELHLYCYGATCSWPGDLISFCHLRMQLLMLINNELHAAGHGEAEVPQTEETLFPW